MGFIFHVLPEILRDLHRKMTIEINFKSFDRTIDKSLASGTIQLVPLEVGVQVVLRH